MYQRCTYANDERDTYASKRVHAKRVYEAHGGAGWVDMGSSLKMGGEQKDLEQPQKGWLLRNFALAFTREREDEYAGYRDSLYYMRDTNQCG